uniref:Glycosyltransferase n=1 Tax=Desulfobacca acetoxidans TaxID=60893 RepID=A0A7V6DP07_9BACT
MDNHTAFWLFVIKKHAYTWPAPCVISLVCQALSPYITIGKSKNIIKDNSLSAMIVLLILLVASLAYQVLALVALGRFFRRPLPSPVFSEPPGITVLKPVKGLDEDSRECLQSFLIQDYQPYQVLFGVADAADPVVPLLKELRRQVPPGRLEIIFCPEALGHNPKVSILRQLEPHARYDILVVADGDVKVGPDFLGRMAAALQEPGAGLVSCPYRAGPSRSLGSWLEALTISADFIPSVATADYVEGIHFALGAAMALTRPGLKAIGGFAALSDYLADDYQLGWRIHQAGFQVKLLPYVVETVNPRLSFREYLAHQLRWVRTYRVCRPKGYFAYGITHTLVFGLILVLASKLAPWALGLAAAALILRFGLAWCSEVVCLGGALTLPAFCLVPVKDLLAFGLWLASFLGNTVVWKGRRFRLTPEGLLVPMAAAQRRGEGG